MTKILVTGADGFIGDRLACSLERRGLFVRRAVRSNLLPATENLFVTGDLAAFSDWPRLVSGVDSVIHLAGRAHVLSRGSSNTVESYRPINVDAAVRLAEAAVAQRVSRLVFVSSIGVNGNETSGRPFSEDAVPAPVDAYAISKWEAEQALTQCLAGSGTDLVIVRPPLVYGPGVKGNLLRLLKLVETRAPIPLGALRAPRSFIGLDNLCDLLIACLQHPNARGEMFLAAEPDRQSIAALLKAIAKRMALAGRVWRFPLPLLRVIAAAAGKRAELAKLSVALEVDPSKAMRVLNWRPAVSFDDGVAATVDWFLKTH